ncbi:SUMO-activating enzyme subunit 1A [Pleodorina starrii]|uniref:SUMO-activating enzyme subunit 1A n=1 Tax=Pleodorina starrii TaxID=330485 RepID=A0A9W6F8R6_9CHLO|nr:SUMO-activating enzyme subunit 1A [Pleodorina starrii]GLC60539.1 SUMO-activating enzyme subunit 1A [Pleodorina starrii]
MCEGSSTAYSSGGGNVGRWRPRKELGLLLTTLKLLRWQVSLPPDSNQSRADSLFSRLGLGRCVTQLGLSEQGLPKWLRDMTTQPPPPLQGWGGGSGGGDARNGCRESEIGGSGSGVDGGVGDDDTAGAAGLAAVSGDGAGPSEYGVAGEDAAVIAQAVAACGTAVLPYMLQLVEDAIAFLCEKSGGDSSTSSRSSSGGTTGGGGGSNTREVEDARRVELSAAVAAAAAVSVCLAVRHLPPLQLLAAAPQRLLVALGRLRVLVQQRLGEGRCGPVQENASADITEAEVCIASVMMQLSADERLLEGCVPGWLRPVPLPAEEHGLQYVFNMMSLSELYDNQCGGSGAPPQGPIMTVGLQGGDCSGGLASVISCLGAWERVQPERRRSEVAAMAWVVAQREGLMEGSVWRHLWKVKAAEAAGWVQPPEGGDGALDAAGTASTGPTGAVVGAAAAAIAAAAAADEDGIGMWPPRLLRLCGNPLCGNFSGCSEAELKMPWCGRCCAVRYCSADCQRQHWPQHKPECGRWAGRWQRDA